MFCSQSLLSRKLAENPLIAKNAKESRSVRHDAALFFPFRVCLWTMQLFHLHTKQQIITRIWKRNYLQYFTRWNDILLRNRWCPVFRLFPPCHCSDASFPRNQQQKATISLCIIHTECPINKGCHLVLKTSSTLQVRILIRRDHHKHVLHCQQFSFQLYEFGLIELRFLGQR